MKAKLMVSIVAGILMACSPMAFAADEAMQDGRPRKVSDGPMMMASDVGASDEGASAASAVSGAEAAKPAMDEAAMAKFKEYSTPNENHKVLSPLVGHWTYTSKNWMSPDAPAQESSGTAESRWIMGKRFVQLDVKGEHMGMPFNGTQITGYDNAGKEYQSVWFDDMGTGMMVVKGSYDATAKTLTQHGNFNCPMKGNMAMRWVTTFVDPDTVKFEMYGPDEKGVDFKGMEIVYKIIQP